jgi:hypothetical protein
VRTQGITPEFPELFGGRAQNWPSICGVNPTVTQGLHGVTGCIVRPPIVTLMPLTCCGPFVVDTGFFWPFAAMT